MSDNKKDDSWVINDCQHTARSFDRDDDDYDNHDTWVINDCQHNARSFDRDDEENDLNHEYA